MKVTPQYLQEITSQIEAGLDIGADTVLDLVVHVTKLTHDLAIANAAICDLAREVTETDGLGEDGRKGREDYLLEHAYENAVRIVAKQEPNQ